MNDQPVRIAVIGLGYVGLPLARLFATKFPVIGYDINIARVEQLRKGHDSTLEVEDDVLQAVLLDKYPIPVKSATQELHSGNVGEAAVLEPLSLGVAVKGLFISSDLTDISECNYYVVTVPTPTDKNNRPDLTPLVKSSESVGKVLKKGDIVIYESTVYPGVTEDECVPVLERVSGLKFNEDFFVGYSPERINPGDKERTVEKIVKVTAGSTPEIGQQVDALYKQVIKAGTHLASTIKVAEAAKVIENSQRDINIAFVNELAKIFNLMGIDTNDVLEAAGTKWNFLPFKPGLVGGHCIGVDPYYLAQKAQEIGYHPEIILAGRRMNDSMGEYVASRVVKLMLQNDQKVKDSSILILGVTFKENCPDVRNTRVVDVVRNLEEYGANITIFDPLADPEEVKLEYGLETTRNKPQERFDSIVLAVAHVEFLDMDFEKLKKEESVIYDVKGLLANIANGKL